ncbi:MAG: tryptophan synthase subunit beta [Paracoccaceae bacterium]
MTRPIRRFSRQIDRTRRRWPRWGGVLAALTAPGRWWIRVPLALLLMAGGLVGFLPVVGFWMLPLGLLLLAIDLPGLQPVAGRWMVWFRAALRRWNIRI